MMYFSCSFHFVPVKVNARLILYLFQVQSDIEQSDVGGGQAWRMKPAESSTDFQP